MAEIPTYTHVSVPCPLCGASLTAQISMTASEGYTIKGTLSYTVEFWRHIKDHKRDAEQEGRA